MTLNKSELTGKIFDSLKPFIGLIILIIISALISDRFLSFNNLLVIIRQISIIGIIAIGQTFVIMTAGIDLSVGSILSLSVVVIAGTITTFGMFPAILIGIIVSMLAGLINGLGVAIGKVPAFIMTLGMLTFARGLAFLYTAGVPIQINHRLFYTLGNSYLWIFPVPALIFIGILVFFAFILSKTPFGRGVYAIGTNEKAAEIAGVPVKKHLISVYVISGLCAGLGAVLYASQLGLGTPIAGRLYELDSIAAVVVGGTSLFGGKGNLLGTFIGVMIIGVLANILNLRGIDPAVQEMFKGLLIIGAVLVRTYVNDR